MKIKCKDCDEVESFESSTEAKDNDWHKVGAVWICPDCWEEEYADADDDEDYDDDDDDEDYNETFNNENKFKRRLK